MLLLLLIATLSAASAAPAAQASQTVTVNAVLAQTRTHRNDVIEVELRTTNQSAHAQTFHVMNCSWADEWKSDDAQILDMGVDCSKNFEVTLTLQPGQVDARILALAVDRSAAFGAHSFHLGFTAIGSHDTLWSNPVSVNVIATSHDVKTTARRVAPRQIVFALTNTSHQAIEVADHLVLQRASIKHRWSDMTWLSASACAAPPVHCVTLAPGATLDSPPWLGTTCGQCACHANTPAEAGDYRVIAQSCDGSVDYVADNGQPTVTLASP